MSDPSTSEQLQISVQDINCTNAILEIDGVSNYLNSNFEISLNERIAKTLILDELPKLIFIDSLSPSSNYTVELNIEGKSSLNTSKIQFTTLDTTTHHVNWQIMYIGEDGSEIYDLQVLNDTIYAVGQFYAYNESKPYGIAMYDGSDWTFTRLKVPGIQFDSIYVLPKGLYVFSSDDIWYANNGIFHWDGEKINTYWMQSIKDEDQSAEDILAIKNNRLYIRTTKGGLYYYNRINWEKIETGTSNLISNFWYTVDYQNQPNYIYFIANDPYYLSNQLLRLNTRHELDIINWKGNDGIYAGWSNDNNVIYIGGDYISRIQNETTIYDQELDRLPKFMYGAGDNNVFTIGQGSMLYHFNGATYHKYSNIPGNCFFRTMDIENNKVIIGGGDKATRKGIILIGLF